MPSELFEAGAKDVLYLVDLSGYVFRAYHAIAPLTSPAGEPTQAVLGTVNMLERLLRQRRPQLLAVAMDSRTPTFRKQFFPAYKATRPSPPEDLKQQMMRVQQIIEAWRVPVLQCDGYEADDVIATFVNFALEHELRTVIVSADKDLMQLVSDRVLLWDTMRDRVIGGDEVHERFGVETAQVRDLLALTGDPSDNVPGVPSIGPKTARDLLNQYGSLEGIYEQLDSIPRKKLQQTLREHAELATLSQKLVTLEQHVPLECTLMALTRPPRDVLALRRLYEELGFQRHLSNLSLEPEPELLTQVQLDALEPPPVAPANASAAMAQPALETELLTELEPLQHFVTRAAAAGKLALTVELVGDALIGLGLCCEPGQAAYLPLAHRYLGVGPQLSLGQCRDVLGPLLSQPAIQKLTHDGKEVFTWLAQRGFELDRVGFDSMLAGYLLDPGASHTLTASAQRVLGVALTRDTELAIPKLKSRKGQRLPFDELELGRACSVAALEAHSI